MKIPVLKVHPQTNYSRVSGAGPGESSFYSSPGGYNIQAMERPYGKSLMSEIRDS